MWNPFNGSKQSSVMTIKEIDHPDFPLGVFLPDQSRRFGHRTNIESIIPGLKAGHI
ncbi:hypothetical protein HanPSC8_Chr04g0178121 [Helianthus annuus]|nr:hypothetical protein HanPSC8_Chr04g0178121 [Helianthus annuus]